MSRTERKSCLRLTFDAGGRHSQLGWSGAEPFVRKRRGRSETMRAPAQAIGSASSTQLPAYGRDRARAR